MIALALAGSLLVSGAVLAQTDGQAPLPPPPAAPMPPVPPVPPAPPGSQDTNVPADSSAPTPPPPASDAPPPPPPPGSSPAGPTEVTVNSGQGKVATMGTPPDFATLAKHGSITPADASAYPALANDFEHADQNRDGKISKAEYTRWTSGK
jgi:hypothetical protein